MEYLGTKIKLAGWTAYAGEMDILNNADGEHAYYTKLQDHEIIFHVVTELPELGERRKKLLGTDLVGIVFMDSKDDVFQPPGLPGDFLHVIGVVQPWEHDSYRVAVCSRSGVPQFGPSLPSPPIFKKESYFRDFLLTKCT